MTPSNECQVKPTRGNASFVRARATDERARGGREYRAVRACGRTRRVRGDARVR